MTASWIPLATTSDDEIHAVVARVVSESLRIDPARVTLDATLPALGAESIDLVEITMDLEHAFTVLMPERSVLDLAADEAGAGVFEQDGLLTAQGRSLLLARMPGVDPVLVAAGTPVSALTPLFLRVDVWVRLIKGLLEATPRTCAQCAGRLVQGSPARVKCPTCGLEIDLPSGDDIGRAWIRRWIASSSP